MIRPGEVYDDIAEEYDAIREGYPADLIRAAADRGGLQSGARVLEIGCGTGKLTEGLVGLGFTVDAVDPGAKMIEQARRRVAATDAVTFHVGRFEETQFAESAYDAAFSATAFHWLDPSVSWSKVASRLKEGALLGLLTHLPISDGRSEDLWDEFRALLRIYAPSVEPWPPPRTLDALLSGANERRTNASSVWDWIMSEGRFELAREDVSQLFESVATTAVVREVAETADDLIAHLRTTSHYFQIDPAKREAFEDEDRRLIEAHGGVVHSSFATVLMTALRSAYSAAGGSVGLWSRTSRPPDWTPRTGPLASSSRTDALRTTPPLTHAEGMRARYRYGRSGRRCHVAPPSVLFQRPSPTPPA